MTLIRTVGLVYLACGLSGCIFSPTLDGENLLDCVEDEDCPRGGICVARACVAQPLHFVAVEAAPPSVEAGEVCAFRAEAVHSRSAQGVTYEWRQIFGPGQRLAPVRGDAAQLQTAAGVAATYELEVAAWTNHEGPIRQRVQCAAIVTSGAAFIVPGYRGDCSRDAPCGSIEFADAAGFTRFYLGRSPGPEPRFVETHLGSGLDDRELHAGFVYPGWYRDRQLGRMGLQDPSDSLDISCSNCVVSGVFHARIFSQGDYGSAVMLSGDHATVRDLEVVLSGGAPDRQLAGIDMNYDFTQVVEGVRISIGEPALTADQVWALSISGPQSEVRDVEVDLRPAYARVKYGLDIWGHDGAAAQARPSIERAWIATGEAEEAFAVGVYCAAPTLMNVIADARGLQRGASAGLRLDGHASYSNCPEGAVFHSSVFVGGAGTVSRGLWLSGDLRGFSLVNCIIDAGDGFERRAVEMTDDPFMDGELFAWTRSVAFISGKDPSDTWLWQDHSAGAVADLEAALGCSGCVDTTEQAGFRDRQRGDFHLTEASTSFLGLGACREICALA